MTSFQCHVKGCGKKFTSENFLKRHGEVMHKNETLPTGEAKRKGWCTPYGFVDFKEPVTYEEALLTSEMMNQLFEARKAELTKNTDIEVQPTTNTKE